MDEANLTGESTPMEKESVDIGDAKTAAGKGAPTPDELVARRFAALSEGHTEKFGCLDTSKNKTNMLFSGTTVLAVVNQ